MNWAEGMAPSLINDNIRAMMARIAEWRDDMSGVLTTTGTGLPYNLTTNQGLSTPTPMTGQAIAFSVNIASPLNATLAVDGGSSYPLRVGGAGVLAGDLVIGFPYTAVFSGTAWLLRDFYSLPPSPALIPIGGLIDWTSATPPTNFAFANGQFIPQSTYNALYVLFGPNRFATDVGATFALPDLNGRVVAGLDNMGAGGSGAVRINGAGGISGALASAGGYNTHSQTIPETPVHYHWGRNDGGASPGTMNNISSAFASTSHISITDTHTHSLPGIGFADIWAQAGFAVQAGTGIGLVATPWPSATLGTNAGAVTAALDNAALASTLANNTYVGNGTDLSGTFSAGTAMSFMQPTMCLYKIIRIL